MIVAIKLKDSLHFSVMLTPENLSPKIFYSVVFGAHFVGAHSRIGPGTVVDAYAIVGEHTALGSNNRVYSFAVIGGEPQIRPSEQNAAAAGRLHIGDRNIFREGVTISRGSNKGDGVTTIGDNCLVVGLGLRTALPVLRHRPSPRMIARRRDLARL